MLTRILYIARELAASRFTGAVPADALGTVKELREVLALAECGRLHISREFEPLDGIDEVYARPKNGQK